MKRKQGNTRELIAQEAAKIMHEEMLRDYQTAKQKACERLGLNGRVAMPGNEEIQQALKEYIQLYKSDTQPELLSRLRNAALEAMQFLKEFSPRLVGAVLHGTADEGSPVQLHVFADVPEQVLHYLHDRLIPYETSSRRMQYRDARQQEVTVCRFIAGEQAIELFLFNTVDLRQAPRSIVDGKPMKRLTIKEVEVLLADAS